MTQFITPPPLVRASAPFSTLLAELGPLADLVGTWAGSGFTLTSLPLFTDQNSFQLKLNATYEHLTFTPIAAPIPDRGFSQPDIFYVGLQYSQQVSDLNTQEALHVESGLWLNVPPTTSPPEGSTLVRLGTIPHGNSLLAQGVSSSISGPPTIDSTSKMSIPFTLDNDGHRIPVTDGTYLDPFNTVPPRSIPPGSIDNPNVVLTDRLQNNLNQGFDVVSTVELFVNAQPVGGINGTPISPQPENVGGIVNIPFITANANAISFSALFWIENVSFKNGPPTILQLQYTQTTLLFFEELFWPHISVATLLKQ